MNKLARAAQRLREENISYFVVGRHQIIADPEGKRVAYWPSNGRFYPRNKGNPKPTSHLNGIEDLINYLKGE